MNYQKLILVGNATNGAQSRKSKTGDVAYTTFGLAVSSGNDRTTFIPVIVFGKAAASARQYVTKGRQVLVEGRIEVSTNGRFNVVTDRMQLGPSLEASANKSK